MWVRSVAGWTIIAAGSGLAAISGVLAYNGFETMLSIPFGGWIGPCVAVSLIGLGIAVESEIRARRWMGAAILAALLTGAGLLDRHSGELALRSKVEAAAQADADRKAAFQTASDALARARADKAKLEEELAVMVGNDTAAAQHALGVIVDGKRGPDTAAAMQRRAGEIRADLVRVQRIEDAQTPIVAKGAPATQLPFNAADAALYASMVTLLSIVLAFAGSYVAHGVGRSPEQELEAVEQTVSEMETEVFDLAAFLAARQQAA